MGTRCIGAAIILCGFLFEPASARGEIVMEVGDAGDLASSAQFSTSPSDVSAIRGVLSGYHDADMFAILIENPAIFSATTDAPGTSALDTQLFLFDTDGMGVLANDDIANGNGPYNPRSHLPAGSLASLAAGIYYLAISGWDRDPVSIGGQIFTDDQNYAGVVTAGGPGRFQPLQGWDGNGALNGGVGEYTIALTGVAAIPEPASVVLLLAGILWPAIR